MTNTKADIFIIGAGPAGLFAALSAVESLRDKKISVTIADSNLKAGRKLAVTGNGRCNLTNEEVSSSHYHGQNPFFVNGILGRFNNYDIMEWFTSRGVELKTETNGRIFPVTDQALTIVDRLLEEIHSLGINILLNTKIQSLKKDEKGGFILETFQNVTFEARKVIIATGGLTYPRLGASGDGYKFASQFGHALVPPVPCLTSFETSEKSLFDLQGVQVISEITCLKRDKTIPKITDEVMFTHYGLSGPAIFTLSPFIVREITEKPVLISMNFFPGLSVEDTGQKIIKLWTDGPKRTLGNSLTGIMPKKLAQIILRNFVKCDLEMPVSNVTRDLREKIIEAFTSLVVPLTSARSWDDAQVTSGGISTEKIDPRTLQSQLCPGLYFAGEVLDIDGDCGGYNLQFAFSSGRSAGISAAQNLG